MSLTWIEKHFTKATLFLFFAYVLSHLAIHVLLICICVVLALWSTSFNVFINSVFSGRGFKKITDKKDKDKNLSPNKLKLCD